MNIIVKNKEIFLIIFLLIFFSILFNQYYGNIGVQPIDSFFPFNSGYDVLNGMYPFKDYWTITGPFIDVVQALFLKYLVFHGSVMFCMHHFSILFLLCFSSMY